MKKPRVTSGEIFIVNRGGYLNLQTHPDSETDILNTEECPEAMENAKLFKAALELVNKGYNIKSIPDLVEALEIGISELEDCINHNNPTEMDRLNKMKQAIKKAKFEETPKTDNLAGK